jgi:hypothetical protein
MPVSGSSAVVLPLFCSLSKALSGFIEAEIPLIGLFSFLGPPRCKLGWGQRGANTPAKGVKFRSEFADWTKKVRFFIEPTKKNDSNLAL